MTRTTTVTVSLHLLAHGDVECSVAISGRYVPARITSDPGTSAPEEWPDADLLSAATEDGADVRHLLSDSDVQTVCERALDEALERDADAEEAQAEDAADMRREAARERGW